MKLITTAVLKKLNEIKEEYERAEKDLNEIMKELSDGLPYECKSYLNNNRFYCRTFDLSLLAQSKKYNFATINLSRSGYPMILRYDSWTSEIIEGTYTYVSHEEEKKIESKDELMRSIEYMVLDNNSQLNNTILSVMQS